MHILSEYFSYFTLPSEQGRPSVLQLFALLPLTENNEFPFEEKTFQNQQIGSLKVPFKS